MKLVLLALLAISFIAVQAQAGTIVVVGKGVETAPPDTATISLLINSSSISLSKAKASNEATNKKVVRDIIALGLSDKDISRTFASMTRERATSGKENGFSVSNSLSVTVRDFDKLAEVLSVAAADGATNYGQPNYSLSNQESLLEKARVSAYAEAQREAELSAKAIGLKLGKVIKVSVGATTLANLLAGEDSIGMLGGGMSKNLEDTNVQMEIEPIKTQYLVSIEYELVN